MKFYLILSLLFLFTNITFSQKTTGTPEDVVKIALTALTNGDIDTLITVTENSELRKAKELLASVGYNTSKKKDLLNQYKSLKSWEITESTEHTLNNRTVTIVSTKWVISPSLESSPKTMIQKESVDQTVYVNYMLEKFDGKWKIISRKSLN